MIKIIILLLILTFVIIGGWFFLIRGETFKKVSKEGPIIFFGDSLTEGIGASEVDDYPSLVSEELNLVDVINAGVSGDTTEDALKRLQADVLDKNPSLVIVLLGGNDFLTRVSVEETIINLDKIVKRISNTNSAVVLVHIKTNPLNDKYRGEAKKIAEKYQASFVTDVMDGILGNPKLMSDQIHPNAKGYKIMAERISPAVKKLLD